MAVPAHDERDYAFAEKFGLPIRRVVAAPGDEERDPLDGAYIAHAAGERLVNSGPYTGLPADEGGRPRSSPRSRRSGKGKAAVTYRLRDWLISRQRYWGTPIPVIYCDRDGIVPVPEEDLPVRLPDTVDYRGSGENPLNRDEAFLNVTCPMCGGPARRETDTMDTFIDSSWYWFRYLSPEKAGAPDRSGARRAVDPGRPVHRRRRARGHAPAVRPRVDEDDARRRPRSTRTSRSGGSSTRARSWASTASGCRSRAATPSTPTTSSRSYGADTVRLFLMFMGPWDQGGPWSPTGIGGVHRFLNRLWTLALDPHGREPGDPDAGHAARRARTRPRAGAAIRQAAHRTLRDVTADYEAFHFNTMIAKLMELANLLMRYRGTAVAGTAEWDEAVRLVLLMLAPAAPHITEELWSRRLAARGTAVVVDPPRRRGRRSTRRPSSRRPARCRSRSTASSATRSTSRPTSPRPTLEAAVLASERVRAILAGREPLTGHPWPAAAGSSTSSSGTTEDG